MFERYTEKARRVIFYSRYEASHYGAPYIDTDHLLLGLVHEEKLVCFRWIPKATPDSIRESIEGHIERKPPIPTSVDLPLDKHCKLVLSHAKDEADRMNSQSIGTEHLLLGLLREDCPAAKLLLELGGDLEKLRVRFEKDRIRESLAGPQVATPILYGRQPETIEIHGLRWNADYVRDGVKRCRKYNWVWRKAQWKPRDVAVDLNTGKLSFDLTLANQPNFQLVHGGWKKDHCTVCHWELFESDDHHGAGYTNGVQWVCEECYSKFWERADFISGAYGDLT